MGLVEQWKQDRRARAQEAAWTAFDRLDSSRLLEAVRAGASVNAADGAGFTMLHRAIQKQQSQLLGVLDQAGAQWDIPLPDGRTALHLAVETSQGLWVKAALDHKVELERTTILGATALHLASRMGASQIIRMLDQAGASWQAKDKQGLTPLEILGKLHPSLHGTWVRVREDRSA